MSTSTAKLTYADLPQPRVRLNEIKRESSSYRAEPNICMLETVSILSPVLLLSGVLVFGCLQR